MMCSVISVLCIRPRLIYRESRRGTGCAPGAHPGPSHASVLPPPLSPSLLFPLLDAFFLLVRVSPSPSLISVKWKDFGTSSFAFLTLSFSLVLRVLLEYFLFLYFSSFI